MASLSQSKGKVLEIKTVQIAPFRTLMTALKDILLAVIVGWIAAEWFIPPIMKHWALDMTWGPAIAFMIGYCGIRLLPKAEEIIAARLSK